MLKLRRRKKEKEKVRSEQPEQDKHIFSAEVVGRIKYNNLTAMDLCYGMLFLLNTTKPMSGIKDI